jgi:hypothetical protein
MGLEFINVISTKRSGHHAFIAWLREHRGRPTRFINNTVLGAPMAAQVQRLSAMRALTRTGSSPTTVILNYEGVTRTGLELAWAAQRAVNGTIRNVLFVRDPLNLCASLIRRKALPWLEIVAILRQLFAERDWLLMHARKEVPALQLIPYGTWLNDDAYRRRIAEAFDLQSSTRLLDISTYGGGSSFGRSKRLRGPDVVALTTRWHAYRDDAFFNALITHPQLRPCFEAALAGEITDEAGHSLADDAALAHIRTKSRPRSGHLWVDRTVDRLSERQDLFHAIECSNARRKKAHLVRAYMAALISSTQL